MRMGVMMNKLSDSLLQRLCYILFFVAAYTWLLVFYGDQLFRVQELSLFVWDGSFFCSFWDEPAALLSYIALFFTQFCYLPWLGTLLLVVLCIFITDLTAKLSHLPNGWAALNMLPALLLLLYVTNMGYDIYTMRGAGLLFAPFIGVLWSLFIVQLFDKMQSAKSRLLFVGIVALAGYPLFGVYTLSGLLLCTIRALFAQRDWKILLAVLLLLAAVPLIYYRFVYLHVGLPAAYVAGFPLFDFYGNSLPLYLSAISALLLALAMLPIKWRVMPSTLAVCFTLGLVVGLFIFSNRDENLAARLKMERAINANRWDDALSVAEDVKNPTRVQVLYKNLCLFKKGELLDKMFAYPDGSAKVEGAPKGNFSQMCAPSLYFHFGLLNYSYRWAMEQRVQYGMSIENLRLHAKIALYRDERALAEKYVRVLDKTLFYGYLGERLSLYLKSREEMQRDGEYAAVMTLHSYDDEGIEDADFIERTLLRHYTNLYINNKSQLELSLASLLVAKNRGEAFWNKFGLYSQFHRMLPKHLLEAALLYSALDKNTQQHLNIVRMCGGQGSPLNQRFESFMVLLQTHKERTPEVIELFRSEFGDTYWFYFFFTEIG